MWALGCVFVQVLGELNGPIFTASTGVNLFTQIQEIVVDSPDFFSFIRDKDGRHLVESLLAFDPSQRITTRKALSILSLLECLHLIKISFPCSASDCTDENIARFIEDNCPL